MRSVRLAIVYAISLVLLLVGASRCALFTKGDVVAIRYFSPERIKPKLTSAVLGAPASHALVLGAVTSGSSLRERIAFRHGPHELAFYEDLRWTERPETYVRRELGRTLFEGGGFERVAGGAPELDVEVLAFEEVRLANGPRLAHVQLKLLLWDDEALLLEETVTVDRPVGAPDPQIADLVAAMAVALEDAATQVAARVRGALSTREGRAK